MNAALRISILVSIIFSLGLANLPTPVSGEIEPAGNLALAADAYGYTLEEIANPPFSFVSSSPGPNGKDQFGGPYSIGFNFSFYGRIYTDFYLSTNGFLSFGEGSGSRLNTHIPKISKPNALIAPTRLTNDDISNLTGYYNPFLAPLPNNRVLLAYDYSSAEQSIYYRVYGSDLSVVKDVTDLLPGLHNSDTNLRAVPLSNGSTFLAWFRGGTYGNVAYSFLDGSYNRSTAPAVLANPVSIVGMDSLSVTADSANRAVLTWTEADDFRTDTSVPARPYLFYALVDSAGTVLTPPLVYKTTKYSFETSFIGMGLALHIAPGVDLYVDAASPAIGVKNGNVGLPISLGNIGGETASGVTLTAVLNASLTYVSASPTPTSVVGQTVTWNLSNRAPFTTQVVTLVVRLPGSGATGTNYPVTLTAASGGIELESSDNSAVLQVRMGTGMLFVPAIRS